MRSRKCFQCTTSAPARRVPLLVHCSEPLTLARSHPRALFVSPPRRPLSLSLPRRLARGFCLTAAFLRPSGPFSTACKWIPRRRLRSQASCNRLQHAAPPLCLARLLGQEPHANRASVPHSRRHFAPAGLQPHDLGGPAHAFWTPLPVIQWCECCLYLHTRTRPASPAVASCTRASLWALLHACKSHAPSQPTPSPGTGYDIGATRGNHSSYHVGFGHYL